MKEYEIQITVDEETYTLWCNANNKNEVKTRTAELYDENGNYLQTVVIGDYNPIIDEMEA